MLAGRLKQLIVLVPVHVTRLERPLQTVYFLPSYDTKQPPESVSVLAGTALTVTELQQRENSTLAQD